MKERKKERSSNMTIEASNVKERKKKGARDRKKGKS